VAEADAHERRAGADQRLELFDHAGQLRGIARAIGEQNPFWLGFENFRGGSIPGVDPRLDASALERADDVPLGAAIQQRDLIFRWRLWQNSTDTCDQVEL